MTGGRLPEDHRVDDHDAEAHGGEGPEPAIPQRRDTRAQPHDAEAEELQKPGDLERHHVADAHRVRLARSAEELVAERGEVAVDPPGPRQRQQHAEHTSDQERQGVGQTVLSTAEATHQEGDAGEAGEDRRLPARERGEDTEHADEERVPGELARGRAPLLIPDHEDRDAERERDHGRVEHEPVGEHHGGEGGGAGRGRGDEGTRSGLAGEEVEERDRRDRSQPGRDTGSPLMFSADCLSHGGRHDDIRRVSCVRRAVGPAPTQARFDDAVVAQGPAVGGPHRPVDALVGVTERRRDAGRAHGEEQQTDGRHGNGHVDARSRGTSSGHLVSNCRSTTPVSRSM